MTSPRLYAQRKAAHQCPCCTAPVTWPRVYCQDCRSDQDAYSRTGILPDVRGPLIAIGSAWYPLSALRQVDAVVPQREES